MDDLKTNIMALAKNKKNYTFFNQFAFYGKNRDVSKQKFLEKVDLIKNHGYFDEMPIIVTPLNNNIKNGFRVILDGQHRYLACVFLDVKFTFIEGNNLLTEDVVNDRISIYNSDRLNMTNKSYQKIYSNKKEYADLKLHSDNTGFSYSMLSELMNIDMNEFKHGKLTLNNNLVNYVYSVKTLNDVILYHNKKLLNMYVIPIHRFLEYCKKQGHDVDMDRLKRKLKVHGYKLKRDDIYHKIINLYEIYNFSERQENKILVPQELVNKAK